MPPPQYSKRPCPRSKHTCREGLDMYIKNVYGLALALGPSPVQPAARCICSHSCGVWIKNPVVFIFLVLSCTVLYRDQGDCIIPDLLRHCSHIAEFRSIGEH